MFFDCQFVKTFVNNEIDQFVPTIKEKLFGIISGKYEKKYLRN